MKAKSLIIVGLLALLAVLAAGLYIGIGPSPRCIVPGQAPLDPGLHAKVITSSGVKRCYLIYLPGSYSPDTPIPIVFALHGFAGNPEGFRRMTGWEDVAESEGFVVIYPHGSSFPLRWNTTPAAKIENIDDIRFVEDIINDVSRYASIDGNRIFVSGFSQGGSMADKIACQLSTRIAAIALVSGHGGKWSSTCTPDRTMPIISFYGLEDPIAAIEEYPLWFYRLVNVSPDRSEHEWIPLEEWLEERVVRNGCDANPKVRHVTGGVHISQYGECSEGADIIVYRIEGGGHTWPGGRSYSIFGETSRDIDASQEIWDFFKNHPLD